MLFFNSNKVLLLKIFSIISRIKRLYRSRRRNKRPSLSFFVRFFRRAYSFFFHKRFLLKKKNLRKLCLLLSRYKSLRNLSQYNRDRGFRLINLLTIRNLKEIKKFKRLFRFKGKGFSRRRRFFLRRYWEFTIANRRYCKYRRRNMIYNRRTSFPIKMQIIVRLCSVLFKHAGSFIVFSPIYDSGRIEYRLTNTLNINGILTMILYIKISLSGSGFYVVGLSKGR